MSSQDSTVGENFSDDELFAFVDGNLPDDRRIELEAELEVNHELEARIKVLRHIVGTTEEVEDVDM